jgi:hypothetical protein
MIIEGIGMFSTDGSVWVCNEDEWSPNILDMGASPTLMNTGELCFFIHVVSVTSDSDTYQFLLGCSDTNDGTNLNGTVVYPITTPAWAGSGDFLQKADALGGFVSYNIPPNCNLRYWQLYCEFTTGGGAADLNIHAGLCLQSAIPARVGNISQNSGVTVP